MGHFSNYLDKQVKVFSTARRGESVISGFNYCCVCGKHSLFYWDKSYENLLRKLIPGWGMGDDYTEQLIKRENGFCAACGSFFRSRSHAKTILKLLGVSNLSEFFHFLKNNPSFVVYETANYWLFRNDTLKGFGNYLISEFHPDAPRGEKVNGVRNENLESLTFADESIDLLITSEVLEHVVDLTRSLSEIRRVLKNGGQHVFTVPVNNSLPETRTRAELAEDGSINHILPPAIHGGDTTTGILAYRDFGNDINEIIESHGFNCREEKYYSKGTYVTSVYISQKLG